MIAKDKGCLGQMMLRTKDVQDKGYVGQRKFLPPYLKNDVGQMNCRTNDCKINYCRKNYIEPNSWDY